MSVKDKLIDDMNLYRVQPVLLTRYQILIRRNLQKALAGHKGSSNAMKNLLAAVHSGEIQVWVGVAGEDDNRKIIGMMFTQITGDPLLEARKLLIYGLNMEVQLSPAAITKCLNALGQYAKSRGCYAMTAQTSVRGVGRMLTQNGWSNGVTVHEKEL